VRRLSPARVVADTSSLPPDEAKLLERLRRGEDAAYEELVRDHAGRMLSVAKRMLRNEDDAHDAGGSGSDPAAAGRPSASPEGHVPPVISQYASARTAKQSVVKIPFQR